jgi:hypothetical protein
MTLDTTTEAGRLKRTEEIVRDYTKSGNRVGIVRIIGGSVNDMNDYSPADEGEAPKGSEING